MITMIVVIVMIMIMIIILAPRALALERADVPLIGLLKLAIIMLMSKEHVKTTNTDC